MTTDRCPACNAAVPASAQWCTLCYAVLRVPEPVSAVVPAAVPAAAPAPVSPVLALDPILDAPVSKAPPVAGAEPKGWPCLGCGALVPIADNSCSHCGRPFLPSDTMPSLALPGIGDLGGMAHGQRLFVALAAAGVVTVLIVLIAFIGGSIF